MLVYAGEVPKMEYEANLLQVLKQATRILNTFVTYSFVNKTFEEKLMATSESTAIH